MLKRFSTLKTLLLFAVVVTATSPAHAVIARAIPLKDVIEESTYIILTTVQVLDVDKPSMLLTVKSSLKGKPAYESIPVVLVGDSDAKKLNHTPQLLKRLAKDLPVLLFVNKQDTNLTVFAYTNGTWFQMTGRALSAEKVACAFTHCEPALRGTYKGTTAELQQVIADALAKKKAPPEPNLKEPAGLGPEVDTKESKPQPKPESKQKEQSRSAQTAGPVWAVIPSVLVGGPLAVLALLFPAVFGGLLLLLRRWTAALTVASLNSTLYTLAEWDWAAKKIQGYWWSKPAGLWVLMTLLSLAGTLWAWRRHLQYLAQDPNAATPKKSEHIVLWCLSGLALLGMLYIRSKNWLAEPLGRGALVLSVSLWVASAYSFFLRFRPATASPRPALSVEGMLLGCMAGVGAYLCLGLTQNAVGEVVATGTSEAGYLVQFQGEKWVFQAPAKGSFAASPLVVGDRVIIPAAHNTAFHTWGALYCLDRKTGAKLWSYNEANEKTEQGDLFLKQVFSTPCHWQGRLYFGEGFHQDDNCRLFCLQLEDGKLLWSVPIGSHTESSPCIADGKVYLGAGDAGFHCRNALTGEPGWPAPFEGLLHIDANPVHAQGRLFCGGGVVGDALYKANAIFCLDAATGKPIWREETDLPVLGAPTVLGQHVFFGLGNGNFSLSDEKAPRGALLRVSAESGQKSWRVDLPDSVVTKPAVSGHHVFVGCRDGSVYAIHALTGKELWHLPVGSPVLASPLVTTCPNFGVSTSLVVLSHAGQILCLEPNSGKTLWAHSLTGSVKLYSTPALVSELDQAGETRSLYFGAEVDGRPVFYCFADRVQAGTAVP